MIHQLQEDAKAKYLTEPKKPAAATDLAAQAGEGAEGDKCAKAGAKKPAARAGEKAGAAPKTSKAQAAADIAAAMQALGEGSTTGSADALQGDEAPALAGAVPADKAVPTLKAGASAKAQDVAPTAHGNEAQPVATAQATHRPAKRVLAIGVRVKVNATARGPKQAPHVGKEGTVSRQIGPNAWDVAIPRAKRSVPLFVAFDATELEILQ